MVQSRRQLAIPSFLPVWVRANPNSRLSAHQPRSDGLPPYAETQLALFNPAQPYDISLQLVVPTTQSNYDLGNFMTTLTLSDRSNRILITVRKPVSPPLAPFSCPRNAVDRLLSCLRHLSAGPIPALQL